VKWELAIIAATVLAVAAVSRRLTGTTLTPAMVFVLVGVLVGPLVILAVPYASAAAVVTKYGDALDGKVIVDITNPIAPDSKGFVTPDGSSGAQEIAKAAPAGAQIVKAFNTLFSHVLTAGPAEGRPLDVFIAGDDAQAKTRVSAFIESLGLRPMDIGQLPMARTLENVALLQLGLVAHSVKHTDFFLGVNMLS